MLQHVHEGGPLPVEQRVDGQHPGVVVESVRVDQEVHVERVAPGRQPLEAPVEDHQQQQAQDEAGQGVSRDGDKPRQLVEPFVLVDGRERAEIDADEQDRKERHQRQLEGGGHEGADRVCHRHLGRLAVAQVPVDHLLEPDAVLHGHRLAQPVLLDDRLQGG